MTIHSCAGDDTGVLIAQLAEALTAYLSPSLYLLCSEMSCGPFWLSPLTGLSSSPSSLAQYLGFHLFSTPITSSVAPDIARLTSTNMAEASISAVLLGTCAD